MPGTRGALSMCPRWCAPGQAAWGGQDGPKQGVAAASPAFSWTPSLWGLGLEVKGKRGSFCRLQPRLCLLDCPSSGVGQMKFGAWSCEVTPTPCLLSLGSHMEDLGGAVALWSEAGLGWAEAVGCHSQQAGLAHAAPGDPGMWSA